MPDRRALAALLLFFTLLVFLELPGSRLMEPDEARYAEIPREMLASGDFVTPRLDGMHYFEKPPLLYWANAASMAVFGTTAFAARLPTRLAAVGTAAALIVALESASLPGWGAWAALLFLSCPLGWVLARFNLTDGMLTLWMTLSFLSLRRFLQRREDGKRATGALALLGASVAMATLTKGLIGIVFPGGVFLLWIAITGRWRRLPELLLSPAPVLLLAIVAPWFVLMERANPGFAHFFFIHEHFQRFATPEASRPGPIYYFVAAFLVGFLPWTFVFGRTLAPVRDAWRERMRGHEDALFFWLWFLLILVFFSLSHSKLLPYILPAFPAAAALAARAIVRAKDGFRRAVLGNAVLVSLLALGGLGYGVASGELARYGVTALALLGSALLVGGAWWAVSLARRGGRAPLLAAAAGWGGLYLALALALPHVAEDLSGHDVAVAAARVERAAPGATIVSYRVYPQIAPWVLRHPIAVADFVGELGSDGERSASLVWPREEFWRRWRSGEHLLVWMKRRSLEQFEHEAVAPRALAGNRRYVLVANFPAPEDTVPR